MVTPGTEIYVSRTVVNFSRKDDYMVKQMNFFDLKEGYIGLSNTEVTFLDSIFDPFGTATDE